MNDPLIANESRRQCTEVTQMQDTSQSCQRLEAKINSFRIYTLFSSLFYKLYIPRGGCGEDTIKSASAFCSIPKEATTLMGGGEGGENHKWIINDLSTERNSSGSGLKRNVVKR